ncbi:MAG: peptidylprolyl isomerase [Actinobacteria bacterium]|jgi:peptidyl-prolyl cis-trans isomerase B (cyclophilin B)|nr:peptidylprolyl isomerase [Actinomycetota bacterium]
MKRVVTATVIAAFLLAPLPSFAGSKVEKISETELKCKSTKAVAHAAPKISPPKMLLKKPVKSITFVTNCGNIVVEPLNNLAPLTVTAITALAKGRFYNQTLCHRMMNDGAYFLQCGDPTASGFGGPAWQPYADENLPVDGPANYPAGTVAMANSGPNTNGSQFFLVYQDTQFDPNYTIWGKITAGLNIVKAIGAAGVKGGGSVGTPGTKIAIESVIVN